MQTFHKPVPDKPQTAGNYAGAFKKVSFYGEIARLQNSRIFCERTRSWNESERSGANVKAVSETSEIGASRLR